MALAKVFNIGVRAISPNPSARLPKPLFLESQFKSAHLVKGNFRTIVTLPKYVEENEWLAVNVLEFFNYLNTFYGTLTDFCTNQNCPKMTAGHRTEYHWIDKRNSLPAPQYIDFVFTSIQNTLLDESVFPTKAGHDFHSSFPARVREIMVQLFRVFAHIYHSHSDKLLSLSEEAHFNSLFAHFVSFSKEFRLIDNSEFEPMKELIRSWEESKIIV